MNDGIRKTKIYYIMFLILYFIRFIRLSHRFMIVQREPILLKGDLC